MKDPQVLENSLELLIPNRDKDGKWVDPGNVIKTLSKQAASLLGGFRIATETGGYRNNNEEITLEDVFVIRVNFSSEQSAEFSALISSFILLLSIDLKQEMAGYKVNNKVILVPTNSVGNNSNGTLNGLSNGFGCRIGRVWRANDDNLAPPKRLLKVSNLTKGIKTMAIKSAKTTTRLSRRKRKRKIKDAKKRLLQTGALVESVASSTKDTQSKTGNRVKEFPKK